MFPGDKIAIGAAILFSGHPYIWATLPHTIIWMVDTPSMIVARTLNTTVAIEYTALAMKATV